jgi:hypothetical protein
MRGPTADDNRAQSLCLPYAANPFHGYEEPIDVHRLRLALFAREIRAVRNSSRLSSAFDRPKADLETQLQCDWASLFARDRNRQPDTKHRAAAGVIFRSKPTVMGVDDSACDR